MTACFLVKISIDSAAKIPIIQNNRMTDEQINRAIAEIQGWKFIPEGTYPGVPDQWLDPTGAYAFNPDYLHNADECAKLCEDLANKWTIEIHVTNKWRIDAVQLLIYCCGTGTTFCRAVCQVFLKAHGKWNSI